MITLFKNFVDESKVQKKINIRKIISMKEVIDRPIDQVKIKIQNLEGIKKINELKLKDGNTKIYIDVEMDKKTLTFQLKDNRKIDHKMLNLLRNEKNIEISQSPISSENLSKLINLISDGTISGKIAKTIFEIMSKEDKDPSIIVEEKGLKQESDPKALEALIQKVLSSNEDKVKQYKSGKDKLFGFFVGQVMKESKGKGNPQLINKILKEKLNG